MPSVVEDDDFAVEGELVGGEGGDGVGDGAHAVGPVEAFAGEELDLRQPDLRAWMR